MKFTALAFAALTASTTLALPADSLPSEEQQLSGRTSPPVQTAHLVFHAGPVSYTLDVPADGTYVATPRPDLNVNIIDAPDYNAYGQCTFHTSGPKTLVQNLGPGGIQQVVVGPPQPILGVSCLGVCIGTYGDCYRNGQYLGPCCNGFCAANKCRPWTIS